MSKDTFVIYDRKTSAIFDVRVANGQRNSRYYGIGAARAALTRFSKKNDTSSAEWGYAIAETEYYAKNIERMVEKTNMMNGKKFMESINTPYYCSPSSETYWSM
jgi:hypothetical protein